MQITWKYYDKQQRQTNSARKYHCKLKQTHFNLFRFKIFYHSSYNLPNYAWIYVRIYRDIYMYECMYMYIYEEFCSWTGSILIC